MAHPPSVARRTSGTLLGGAAGVLERGGEALMMLGMAARYARFRYVQFTPRADDVFVVTYPRSGTTWTQQIVYQLATDGEMTFRHISEVVPWFERIPFARQELARRPSPRLFKSHLRWNRTLRTPAVPHGPCRYIYVARNGRDVAVSYYHFYRSHLGFAGSFADFLPQFLQGRVQYGSWFDHVADWWAQRNRPNVLFLHYGDLHADLPGALRRIAAFCGFEVADDAYPRILERCSFRFMKEHESVFDHATEQLWERGILPQSFLRRGETGAGRDTLTPEQEAAFAAVFARRLGASGLAFDHTPEHTPPNGRGLAAPPPAGRRTDAG